MRKILKNNKINRDELMKSVWKRWAEIKGMPPLQLVGSILAYAQVIEEFMRMYIINNSKKYTHPRQLKGTFGNLRSEFKKIYPKEKGLLECLENANDTRTDVAHYVFLIAWYTEDMLKKSGQKSDDIGRFNHRTLEKMLYIMEDCLFEFRRFLKKNPPRNYDAKILMRQRDA